MLVLTSAKIRRSIQNKLNEKYPDITFSFHESIEEAEAELPQADVFITYGDDLEETHIQKAKQLKWIMVISAGVENLPFQSIKDKGILVTNARGIHRIPMAEYTIGVLIATVKNMKEWFRHEQNGEWGEKSLSKGEISGKTIAILGAGAIGEEIARLAKAFNMRTLGLNRSGRPVPFYDDIYLNRDINECVAQADFVVAVLPYTKETDQMIGKEQFQAMKNDCVFVNIGRGKTVVQEELLEALNNEEIAHAVLDVFEEEPLPENHPFWQMPQVTVTPHLSSISPKYQHRAFDIFEENLRTFLDSGKDYRNEIDCDRGY